MVKNGSEWLKMVNMWLSIAMGIPNSWMVYVRENPINIKMNRGTPISGNLQIVMMLIDFFESSWVRKILRINGTCKPR